MMQAPSSTANSTALGGPPASAQAGEEPAAFAERVAPFEPPWSAKVAIAESPGRTVQAKATRNVST